MDLEDLKKMSSDDLNRLRDSIDRELSKRDKKTAVYDGVVVYSDGASRGNPGHAGAGILVFDLADHKLFEDSQYLGTVTNNEAEYRALLLAIGHAERFTKGEIRCVMDSELVVRQMTGRYAIKSEKMSELSLQVKEKLKHFSSYSFAHVPREHPKLQLADKLANKGIDRHFSKGE